MLEKPNVLLLTIDALRADRMSLNGYGRPTTPNLDRLAQNAWVCDQAVSMGAFTQVSFHSFMTSSMPLNHGGYDLGGEGRPPNIFGQFKDHGYETISISTFPWITRFCGYPEDAVDRQFYTFILNAFVGLYGSSTMGSYLRAWHDDKIPIEEAVKLTRPWIMKTFDYSEEYCRIRQEQNAHNKLDFEYATFMKEGFSYRLVLNSIARHRQEYFNDPAAYLRNHLKSVPNAHDWMGRDWRYFCRIPSKYVEEITSRAANRLVGLFSPQRAALRKHRYKRYVDAKDLSSKILREVRERESPEKPFFLWSHFCDLHIPFCPGPGPDWYKKTAPYLKNLDYPRDLDLSVGLKKRPENEDELRIWSALYDTTLNYVDEKIGEIINGLDELGLRENTLIVFCGDHGEELGEHGDISHHFRLYDHNIRVPLIFHHPKLEQTRINSLVTLLDLAPTIAHLSSIPPVDEWVGEVVSSPQAADRDHVLVETFHGGNCLFDHRPIYMALRTSQWKYLWKEFIDPTDHFSPSECELYELDKDPLEQKNVFRQNHPVIKKLNPLIIDRLREIPEISADRVSNISRKMGIGAVSMAENE